MPTCCCYTTCVLVDVPGYLRTGPAAVMIHSSNHERLYKLTEINIIFLLQLPAAGHPTMIVPGLVKHSQAITTPAASRQTTSLHQSKSYRPPCS